MFGAVARSLAGLRNDCSRAREPVNTGFRQLLAVVVGVLVIFVGALNASVASHALILWPLVLEDHSANLPGIDLDAAMAKRFAGVLGTPDSNVYEYKNRELTLVGFRKASAP